LGHDPKSSADFGHVPRTNLAQTGVAPVNGIRGARKGLLDGPPAIVCYDANGDVWNTVATGLPVAISDGSCLFATDDTTLYVLGGGRQRSLALWYHSGHLGEHGSNSVVGFNLGLWDVRW